MMKHARVLDTLIAVFVLLFVVLTAAGAAKQAARAVRQFPVLRPVLMVRDYPSGVLAGWLGDDTPSMAAVEGGSMADYTGSNAGTAACNGPYIENGTYNGYPKYDGPNGFYLFVDLPGGQSVWYVGEVVGQTDPAHYSKAVALGDPVPTGVAFDALYGASPGIEFAEAGGGYTQTVTLTLHKQSRNRVRVKVSATTDEPGATVTEIRITDWDLFGGQTDDDVETYSPPEGTFPVEAYFTHDYARTPATYTVQAQATFLSGITEVPFLSDQLEVTTQVCKFVPQPRLM